MQNGQLLNNDDADGYNGSICATRFGVIVPPHSV